MTTNAATVLSDQDCRRPPSVATRDYREILSGFNFDQTLEQILDRLNDLANLSANWDSYGAKRIDTLCIRTAFNVLASVMREDTPAPWIVPTPDGHVQFEWHTQGIDLEVEVSSAVSIHVSYEDHWLGQPPLEVALSYDLSDLNEFVGELTHRTR